MFITREKKGLAVLQILRPDYLVSASADVGLKKAIKSLHLAYLYQNSLTATSLFSIYQSFGGNMIYPLLFAFLGIVDTIQEDHHQVGFLWNVNSCKNNTVVQRNTKIFFFLVGGGETFTNFDSPNP